MPRSSASVRAWSLIVWAARTPCTGDSSGSRFSSSRYLVSCSTASIPAWRLISTATCSPVVVAAHDVDRADRGGVLAADQPPAVAEQVQLLGEQLLQVRLDAVLDQAGVDAEVDGRVGERLLDRDRQRLAGLVGDRPLALRLARSAGRRRHPVQRLVGAAVGMHEDRPVGLDDQQPEGGREMGGEPAVVVDAAPRDDKSHGTHCSAD